MCGSVRALCGSGELECIDRDETAGAVAAVPECADARLIRFYYGSIRTKYYTKSTAGGPREHGPRPDRDRRRRLA